MDFGSFKPPKLCHYFTVCCIGSFEGSQWEPKPRTESHLTCYPSSSSQAHLSMFVVGSGPVTTAGEPQYAANAVPAWCIGPAQSCCSADSMAPSPSPTPGRTLQEGEGDTGSLYICCLLCWKQTRLQFIKTQVIHPQINYYIDYSNLYKWCL